MPVGVARARRIVIWSLLFREINVKCVTVWGLIDDTKTWDPLGIEHCVIVLIIFKRETVWCLIDEANPWDPLVRARIEANRKETK